MAKKKQKKEETKEKETVKEKESKTSKVDRELYWILGVMVGLILAFLVANSVFESLNHFNHGGLSFTKKQLGEIELFHYYYSFTDPGAITGSVISEPRRFNLYLRHDPRENDVPISGAEMINFRTDIPVTISILGDGLTQCEFSNVAVSNLATFFTANLIDSKGATLDEELAEQAGIRYASCEDSEPMEQIIEIRSGEETKIEVESASCFKITAANCEILPAIEKFTVQAIINAKEKQSQLAL